MKLQTLLNNNKVLEREKLLKAKQKKAARISVAKNKDKNKYKLAANRAKAYKKYRRGRDNSSFNNGDLIVHVSLINWY